MIPVNFFSPEYKLPIKQSLETDLRDEIDTLKEQNARLVSALKSLIDATVQIPVDRRAKWASETSENARLSIDMAQDAIKESEAQK